MTPLSSPNLDDRDFRQLLEEAVAVVRRSGSPWNELTASDPGMVLLEAFAYLTDLMLYRINRLPEKAYVELLRLLGVRRQPPSAAVAELKLTPTAPDAAIVVPAGTRVTSATRIAGESVAFVTDEDLHLSAGAGAGRVTAHHCDEVRGELLGVSTGQPAQRFSLARPPVIRRSGHELDLVIGVEADPEELAGRPRAREHEGRAYIVWREVEAFAGPPAPDRLYVVDRVEGTVTFAPAVRLPDADGSLPRDPVPVAVIPRAGAQVRAWYRRGGGVAGNVAPATLTEVELAGVEVTNPDRAVGGTDAETVDNAVLRGAQELHEPRRAVTADDVESLAARVGGVSRVRASTAEDVWAHALPGTVEVILVPEASGVAPAELDLATLESLASPRVLEEVVSVLERRKPLGVRLHVLWAELKPVSVVVSLVVDRAEDPVAVQRRVLARLNRAISPVPREDGTSWPFGRSLRASDVFDLSLREPGVRYVDTVRFELEEVPDRDVRALAADRFQPRTWYASSGSMLFRSRDDGRGWEPTGRFPEAEVTRVVAHPARAGLVALIANVQEGEGGGSSGLWVSRDCGSSWPEAPDAAFAWDAPEQRQLIHDVAWLRDEATVLLATDRGLYSHAVGEASPVPRAVDPERESASLYAVATAPTRDGGQQVIVAMQARAGVRRSVSGAAGPFEPFGLEGEDVRRLDVVQRGQRWYLWAATFAVGDDPGRGCFRTELREEERPGVEWRHYGDGWEGGICHDIAVRGDTVIAASHFAGVLTLDVGEDQPVWRRPSLETSNLPLVESGRFDPVRAVDVGRPTGVVMAGGRFGVYRTSDLLVYRDAAMRVVESEVRVPPEGLFCSGRHRVEVRDEDEAG